MSIYHYTECGLMNVFIEGLPSVKDDDGDDIITIPQINVLHRSIAQGIVCHGKGMSGDELRFIRSEMGYTQAELSKILHVDKQTVGRWERSENEIDGTAEALVRKLAIEKLDLDVDASIDELSAKSVPTAEQQPIRIQSNDGGYRLIDRAA